MSFITDTIADSIRVKQALLQDAALLRQVEVLADAITQSLRSGGKVLFAGNGGSFADAQHLAAEFVSRFAFDRRPLAGIALGTNNSIISAVGNDYGYEDIFARELEALATKGDIFVPISTSGNSANILRAVEKANQLGVKSIALTGQSGGKLKAMCECLCMPSSHTPRIQECHIVIGHIICELAEKALCA